FWWKARKSAQVRRSCLTTQHQRCIAKEHLFLIRADRQVVRAATSVMEIAESDSLANWESRGRLHASMIPRLTNDAKSSTPCGVRHGAAVPYAIRQGAGGALRNSPRRG